MAYNGDADIDAMLRAVGVPISFDADGVLYEGYGSLNENDRESPMGEAVTFTGALMRVTVRTTAWPGLAAGSSLIVEGVPRAVVHVRRVDDGALTHVYCKTV